MVHIKTDLEGFKKVIALLSQPKIKTIIKNSQDIKFTEKISVKNLSFRYSGENHLVLNKVNFVIKKGERIGIIGETGSGKSTLTDLLLGLLKPTNGSIFIDDVELNTSINSQNLSSWKKILAHVPQSIYLADRNIFENIAFGVQTDQIDINKIYYAAKQAQIHDFILRLPNGYNTFVGERGVKLSGGQRQRIGIARAIYKGAKVLFFDEATSALDDKTEKEVMDAIYSLNKDLTIILIAHRLNTVSKCDQIIEIKGGEIN